MLRCYQAFRFLIIKGITMVIREVIRITNFQLYQYFGLKISATNMVVFKLDCRICYLKDIIINMATTKIEEVIKRTKVTIRLDRFEVNNIIVKLFIFIAIDYIIIITIDITKAVISINMEAIVIMEALD